MDQRKTGINGRNVIISITQVSPFPSKQNWESFFGMDCIHHFNQSPVGYRPDTVILSNLPVKWFQLENRTLINANHPLFVDLSQFGDILSTLCFDLIPREMQRMDTSPLFATVGVVFKSYDGFCNCITHLRDHIMTKAGIKKEFLLHVDFDKTHYFSKETKRRRMFVFS